jgi:hypothetical protein
MNQVDTCKMFLDPWLKAHANIYYRSKPTRVSTRALAYTLRKNDLL